MQTLDIDRSVPQAENLLKRLFWPSIRSVEDVDTLATQGFWVCAIVAAFAFAAALNGQPIAGISIVLFYYVGAIGVREHSLYAAGAVFLMYFLSAAASFPAAGFMITVQVILVALLLSNFRATWIASDWKAAGTGGPMPLRLDETWRDKLADKWPQWLWPKLRIFYYIYSTAYLALVIVGLTMIISRRHG
jgi:hypothetical protein